MLIEAEKNNLNKLLTRYSFEHLRPMPEVYEIDIPCTPSPTQKTNTSPAQARTGGAKSSTKSSTNSRNSTPSRS